MMNQQPSLSLSLNHVTRMNVVQRTCPGSSLISQRHSPGNPPGPCRRQLHRSLQISHKLLTDCTEPTNMAYMEETTRIILLLTYLFFATTLRLCSQLRQLPHSENLWGRKGLNYSRSFEGQKDY